MTYYEITSVALNIIFLAIGAYGLKQIKIGMNQIELTKKDIYIRNRRESITLTANLCGKFPEILRRSNHINDKIFVGENKKSLEAHNQIKYSLEKENLCKGKVLSNKTTTNYLILTDKSGMISDVNDLVNDLEAFSIYFNEEVADIEIGYITVGRAFCSVVEKILPHIMFSRCEGCNKCENTNKNIYYENLLNVYINWKSRIEYENSNQEISKSIERNNELAKKSKFQKPLGYN